MVFDTAPELQIDPESDERQLWDEYTCAPGEKRFVRLSPRRNLLLHNRIGFPAKRCGSPTFSRASSLPAHFGCRGWREIM